MSTWPTTGPRRWKSSPAVQPDLVLLDVMLPRVSGIDVCRTIRAAGRSNADHHGHGEDERDRHGGRPRSWRRRLRQQAVPFAGASGPHAGRAAPHPAARRRSRRGRRTGSRRPAARPRTSRGLPARPGGQPPPERVRATRATDDQRREGPYRGRPSSTGSGDRTM